MSVAEREIFEGFDDRAPFEIPKANEDIKLPRYLFTAANHITHRIARERPHMKAGGLNVYNPCLTMSRDFIRRGRIVPLLISQHVPFPVEDANMENSDYFTVPLDGESLRAGGPFEVSGMVSKAAFPGQQIQHILEGSSNVDFGNGQRVGIVELETLKGHEYKLEPLGNFRTDPELWKIQKEIFPDYPDLPFALRPFTELIRNAIDRNSGDIRSIAEEMLPSCQMFEAWGIRHIENVHQNMAQAAVKGYSSPYQDVDLLVLEQLEMHREDEHYKRTAQQVQIQAQQPAKLSHEEYLAMKAEVIAELKAEQSGAVTPFAYVPDAFIPNGVNPSLCATCGFDKLNRSAHPEALQVSENTMKAEPPKTEKRNKNSE